MATESRRGVFPGSFDPLTVAHLAICDAAMEQFGLQRLDLAISLAALGKDHLDESTVAPRIESIERAGRDRPWLGAVITEAVLIADISAGYDVVVMGADKWAQVNDPAWYGDDASARDQALTMLPTIAVAPRGGIEVPPGIRLEIPDHLAEVSSTAVRNGRRDWSAHG